MDLDARRNSWRQFYVLHRMTNKNGHHSCDARLMFDIDKVQLWQFENKIVLDGITVRLAHIVGRNVSLVLLNNFRDRFTFQMDAPSASI